MTDRYENIRKALAMGPTPGPWIVTHELRECDETVCDLVNGTWIVTAPGVKLAHWEYDAAHIAACDPDTIRALLAERDALAAEVERLRRGPHPAITHCDNCGCDWLDNGLNPIGCPYCKQTASVDEVKEPDLWRCTVCGRVGTVGRCCGEREPVNHAVLSEENSND